MIATLRRNSLRIRVGHREEICRIVKSALVPERHTQT
jgi:hypothetical protein